MSGIILLILRSALTITLYTFLGWALWLLWRDLRNQSDNISLQQVAPLSISMQIGDISRKEQYNSPDITIGRDPTCEFVINSKTVSTYHAHLSYHHGQWWLEDLESTNGTLLNQESVSTQTVVATGDQIQCGEAILTIEKNNPTH
jgi:pSer/pThr/pTyr-binding forkhead associated (FHA) protein